MKTNRRLIQRLMLVTVMMMCVAFAKAESYSAGYDRDTQTLILYRSGGYSGAFDAIYDVANSTYDLPNYYETIGLSVPNEIREVIKKVVFHSSFKTAQFTNIFKWFTNFTVLTSFEGLENFDMTQVTDASYLFANCRSLKTLDLSQINMKNLEIANNMFLLCLELTSLKMCQTSNKLKDMSCMFYECESLISIDVSRMDTSGVEEMGACFFDCTNVRVLDLSTFDTSSLTEMNWMFKNCENLEVVYLHSFNTSKVTEMSLLFDNCKSLTDVVVGDEWTTENFTLGGDYGIMFGGCVSLKGEAGTMVTYEHRDKEYARIDNPPDEPGYFRRLIEYDLWVGGIRVTELNQDGIPFGEGTVKYDPETQTLTMLNAVINSSSAGIFNGNPNTMTNTSSGIDGLTIEIFGKCSIDSETYPMYLMQNTTIKDYYLPGESELVMTGKNSIIFLRNLTFNNGKTLLTNNSSGLLHGNSNIASLAFGDNVTFTGIGGSSSAVSNVSTLTLGSNTQLLSPSDAYTVTFSPSEKKVLLGENPMTDYLLVGHYYPLWLGEYHLSTAMVFFLNKVAQLLGASDFNIEVSETPVYGLTQYDMKVSIPSSSGQSFRSEAPFLTMELTGDCTFNTTEANTPAMDLDGYTIIKGTGKLTASSEDGPAIKSTVTNAMLTIEDIDLDVYGKTGGLQDFPSLYLSRVAGTVSCDEGYCVSGTSSFSHPYCYITNDVTFDKKNGRINAKSLVLAREPSTIATEIDNGQMSKGLGQSEDWYTIDGRKLNAKPTKKGIYINNGNRFVIK